MQWIRTRLAEMPAPIARFWMRCATLVAVLAVVAVLLPGVALAASPAPYSATNDTRTGATPSYVGHPILAAVFVVGLAVLVAGVTVVTVRLTRSQ